MQIDFNITLPKRPGSPVNILMEANNKLAPSVEVTNTLQRPGPPKFTKPKAKPKNAFIASSVGLPVDALKKKSFRIPPMYVPVIHPTMPS
jgi:hypothetical protein